MAVIERYFLLLIFLAAVLAIVYYAVSSTRRYIADRYERMHKASEKWADKKIKVK